MEHERVGAGCGVMLVKDGTVLLGHRHADPEKAGSELHGEGTWTVPGGKFDFGDSLTGGACREVKEETGVEVDPSSLEIVSVSSDRVPDAHFITIGFLATRWSGPPATPGMPWRAGEPRVMEPDEITEWRWFPLDALPDPMFPPTARIIRNYLAKRLFVEADG
jgi:8-oxo-dGTP diphosphatase